MPTTAQKILIVEDEATLRSMLCYALESAGYDVNAVESVMHAKVCIEEQLPHLIVLDWMLPNISGVDFAMSLKRSLRTKHVPIILLTAKANEDDKLAGFEAGVDDYVIKPFSTKVLVARIQAVLRRSDRDQKSQLVFGKLQVDLAAKRLLVSGASLRLSPIEYKLFVFLATHPDRVYSRDQLLTFVWGADAYLDERTVDVQLRRLRNKLRPFQYDRLIQTVRGEGYRFSEYD